ncbi:hypothetical protein N0V88_003318 [Collariella sp. IMI 366227]|nr:hypothetical protein N0V88_003318 [Collariella sp. IMI 366227]
MADLTTAFNALLEGREAPPTKPFSSDTADEFLKEAYRIQNGSIALTDRDREEIDANAKINLRDLNASIRALEDAEQLRQNTEAALLRKRLSRGLGVLGSWAHGAGAHRESVIWYLRTRLQETARTQQRMMETRLTREMEKNRRGVVANGAEVSLQEEEDRKKPAEDSLTDGQKQLFEKGNQDMIKHLESTLDKVRTAESSLVEIAELQNLLVNNLATQSAHIDQLVADSFETTEGIGKGNKELKKSAGRASPARYTFFTAAGLCTALILWDLIN